MSDTPTMTPAAAPRRLTRADILPLDHYARDRREHRRRISEIKKLRRVEVGPFATFYFESYDTMWHQVHEMLYIEKGGEAQIADELNAYNPLIPRGSELIATVMFEVDDPVRRKAVLSRLGGIENAMFLSFAGETLRGIPDAERENTDAEGKASAVQFVTFPFDAAQKAKFRTPGTQILVGFDHPHYGHLAVMPEAVRATLARDLV